MRKMTLSGTARGVVIALLLSVVPLGLAYRYLGLGTSGEKEESAAVLAGMARKALESVKSRDLKGTLRPAKYDDILGPLDRMLRVARNMLQDPSFDPVRDYETIESYCLPVMEIALEANDQARRETAFLRKDYRFMQQRGDACQYLATAMWNRLEALHAQSPAAKNGAFQPGPADLEKLYAVVDAGIAADSENKNLWYLRGVVGKAGGAFAAAGDDLRKAIGLDEDYAAAWNVLGLVLINLQNFDGAEKAFETAARKSLEQAERAGARPAGEYTAALFNLAHFHEGLLTYYERAERLAPSPGNKEELLRHRAGAEAALRKILSSAQPGSPERLDAQERLAGLGSR